MCSDRVQVFIALHASDARISKANCLTQQEYTSHGVGCQDGEAAPQGCCKVVGAAPQTPFLVRFGGEAAKPNQKNLVGRRSLPTPHRRRRTLQQP
jgi:hypothetical protein